MTESSVILYHHPCHDSIFAALAAHLHFRRQVGSPARFVPHKVYETLDERALSLTKHDTVYLLDYCGPPGFVQRLGDLANRVILLDHHKTAFEMFERPAEGNVAFDIANCSVNLDMDRSGATMALDHWKPEGLTDMQRQMFLYVEDGDLWRWKLPQSKEFYAGLIDLRLDYDATLNYQIWDQLLELTPKSVIERGTTCIATQKKVIADIVAKSFTIQLGGAEGSVRGWGKCLAARGDSATDLRSQIGNALAAKSQAAGLRAIGAVIYVEPGMDNSTEYKVSLRSLGEEGTTAVSSALGGGGHRNASSFTAAVQQVDSWTVLVDST